jgi:hypothetical protein
VLNAVQDAIVTAQKEGTKTDLSTILGGQLYKLMGDIKSDLKTLTTTEAVNASNVGIHDAIGRVGASLGNPDPVVYYICVHDAHLCVECKRLHLMDDLKTPRLWYMSELGSGYHKKGDTSPKVGGLHPCCRCALTHLLPGYGFDSSGHIEFKSLGHEEIKAQRESQ